MPPPAIYYILQILVPAILIISGWFVLYRNSVKIETRKEAREFIEKIEFLIDKIQTQVNKYYCSDNMKFNGNLSCSIKADFLLLSHYLFIMKGLGLTLQNSEHLVAYKKATTGAYFETADYLKQTDIPGWEADCVNHAAKLKLSVRTAYFRWSGSYKVPKDKIKNQVLIG
jgi:hypothetical protein